MEPSESSWYSAQLHEAKMVQAAFKKVKQTAAHDILAIHTDELKKVIAEAREATTSAVRWSA